MKRFIRWNNVILRSIRDEVSSLAIKILRFAQDDSSHYNTNFVQRFCAIMFLFSFCATAFAETNLVEGKLVNGTTQSSGKAERVTLISLEQGMEELASLKDVHDSFQFSVASNLNGPFMLRATHQGVNYFTTLGPFQAHQKKVHEVTVFDSIPSMDKAIVALPHLFIKRADNLLIFSWSYEVANPTKTTMNILGGLFRVHIPEGAQDLSVSASSGKIPLRASLAKDPDGAFRVSYAIKPGKTSFEIVYSVDYTKEQYSLQTKSFYTLTKVLALFYPEDMRVESAGLKEIQVDTANHVKVAGWDSISAGSTWAMTISGGSRIAEPLPTEQGEHSQAQHGEEDHQVVERNPSIAKIVWLLFALMAIGLGLNVAMFLKSKAAAPAQRFDFPSMSAYREKLLQLSSARKSGALDDKTFREREQALLREAWKSYCDESHGN